MLLELGESCICDPGFVDLVFGRGGGCWSRLMSLNGVTIVCGLLDVHDVLLPGHDVM